MHHYRGFTLLEASGAAGAHRARLRLEPASPLFAGHFPGHPILPAIAHLGLALGGARGLEDRELTLVGVRGIRFRRLVEPGEDIEVIVTRGLEAGALRFELRCAETLASSGMLVVRADARA